MPRAFNPSSASVKRNEERIRRLLAIHAPGDDLTGEDARDVHAFLSRPDVPQDHPVRKLVLR